MTSGVFFSRCSYAVWWERKPEWLSRRRQEGQVLVIADQKGEEISIPQAEIEQTKSSRLSLMPANYPPNPSVSSSCA